MYIIKARNVHSALPEAIALIKEFGVERPSRNGEVRVLPEPLTTVYSNPRERVVFHPARDANPFFHLMESLWMLSGRRDVDYVAKIVPGMRNFSDDGKVFNAAYGFRWRKHFGIDQITWVINLLRSDPSTRRAVIAIWDGHLDPFMGDKGSKDLPCNLSVHFQVSPDGYLNMTVFNRSNDIIWGAYGANAVHFSMLHEFVAFAAGFSVGKYWQVSDNWHAYKLVLDKLGPVHAVDPYVVGKCAPYPIITTAFESWFQDLEMFLDQGPTLGIKDPFFRKVAGPMMLAHRAFKTNEGDEKYESSLEFLLKCEATDWRIAAEEWILRRWHKYREKKVENETVGSD